MSKELEALERLSNKLGTADCVIVNTSMEESVEDIATITKSLKALKIIADKKVDMFLIDCTENVERYNDYFCDTFSLNRQLTEVEYRTIKEVIKNE